MYTFDGRYIKDLDHIPEDTKIILVSENPGPKDQDSQMIVTKDFDCASKHGSQFSIAESAPELIEQIGEIKGLRNNIYEYNSKSDYIKHKINEIEDNLHNKKHMWLSRNLDKWNKCTPHIYDYHKDMDQKLHKASTNQVFVSVKRIPPKLP